MELIDTAKTRTWQPGGHAAVWSRDVVSSDHGAKQVAVHISTIAPGGSSEVSRHPDSEQVFVMLSGQLTFLDGQGSEWTAGPGQAMFVPANDPHGTLNRGSVDAVCLVVTAPPLE